MIELILLIYLVGIPVIANIIWGTIGCQYAVAITMGSFFTFLIITICIGSKNDNFSDDNYGLHDN